MYSKPFMFKIKSKLKIKFQLKIKFKFKILPPRWLSPSLQKTSSNPRDVFVFIKILVYPISLQIDSESY